MKSTEYRIFDPKFPRKEPYQRRFGRLVEKTWTLSIVLIVLAFIVPDKFKKFVFFFLLPLLFLQTLTKILNFFSEPPQVIPTIGSIRFYDEHLSVTHLNLNIRYSELEKFECLINEYEGQWINLSVNEWKQITGKAYISYGGNNWFQVNENSFEFQLRSKKRMRFLKDELLPFLKRKTTANKK